MHEKRTRNTLRNGLCFIVRCHSLLVCRAHCTNDFHSWPFALCISFFVHVQNCARNSMHKCTCQKDTGHARGVMDQCPIHVEHTLGIHCVFFITLWHLVSENVYCSMSCGPWVKGASQHHVFVHSRSVPNHHR